MIQSNELRIGNYVNVPRKDQSPFRIDGFEYLNKNNCKVEQYTPEIGGLPVHPLTWYLSDLQPIPITEEWLLKFGFEDVTGVDYILNIDVDFKLILIPADAFYPQIDKADDIGWSSISLNKIEYIHQLQNLYFALTSNELTQVSEGEK